MKQIQGQALCGCGPSTLKASGSMWCVCEPLPLFTKDLRPLFVVDVLSNVDTYFVPWKVSSKLDQTLRCWNFKQTTVNMKTAFVYSSRTLIRTPKLVAGYATVYGMVPDTAPLLAMDS